MSEPSAKKISPLLVLLFVGGTLGFWALRQDRAREELPDYGPSVSGNPAGDRGLLTERVRRDISRALPSHKVSVKGELALTVELPGDAEAQVFLDNLWDQCYQSPGSCEYFIADHVKALVENVQRMGDEGSGEVGLEQVLLSLKTDAYLEELERRFAEVPEMQAENAILHRPFGGEGSGLHEVLVIDLPESLSMMSAGVAKKLGLTAEAAFELGRKNLVAFEGENPVEPVRVTEMEGAPGLWALLTDDSYGAARALNPARWKKLAATLPGPLVAAFPNRDLVLFTAATGEQPDPALEALTAQARAAAEGAPYALSAALFTWTGEGWESHDPAGAVREEGD